MSIAENKTQLFNKYLERWAKGAYCVFSFNSEAIAICKDGNKLVENCFVDYIVNNYSSKQLNAENLTIYLNYSSVSHCVNRMIQLCDQYDMNLEIVSANPCYLHRVSSKSDTQYSQDRQHQWYVDNTEGVKKLMESERIRVRGFRWQDWNELQTIINDCENIQGDPIVYTREMYQLQLRAKQDDDVAADFAAIPYLVYNQTKRIFEAMEGMYGLIFYSPNERDGAKAEAENLKTALEATGFVAVLIERDSALDMQQDLWRWIDLLKDKARVSLLMTCFLSHGTAGHLTGGGDSSVPVNDILNQLKEHLPAKIPLIMLIQACQRINVPVAVASSKSNKLDMAKMVSSPVDNKHIVLQRPHTVLLLSTVTGGVAKRGAYTGAIADEIRQSDGKTDIYHMHNAAVRKMFGRSRDVQQVPEYRDTLQQQLVFPAAINTSRKRKLYKKTARLSKVFKRRTLEGFKSAPHSLSSAVAPIIMY